MFSVNMPYMVHLLDFVAAKVTCDKSVKKCPQASVQCQLWIKITLQCLCTNNTVCRVKCFWELTEPY